METKFDPVEAIKRLEKQRDETDDPVEKFSIGQEIRTIRFLGLNSMFGATTMPRNYLFSSEKEICEQGGNEYVNIRRREKEVYKRS